MDIKLIKRNAEISGLTKAIDDRIFEISHGTFSSYKDRNVFISLGSKIATVRRALDQMELLLKEVNKLDGVSK
jgi:hypothetical protein